MKFVSAAVQRKPKLLINGEIMKDKITFEENMTRLGKIVSELEKGEIPLEKAVELYGEGVRLSAQCRKQLGEAQIKITEDDGCNPSEK